MQQLTEQLQGQAGFATRSQQVVVYVQCGRLTVDHRHCLVLSLSLINDCQFGCHFKVSQHLC